MTEFDPSPPDEALSRERTRWKETTNTRDRIRAVVMGQQEPATVSTIAERAQCSANAARDHLEAFAELGVVRASTHPTGTQYVRNEAYIHWRRANELRDTHTTEELLDRLAELETTDEAYQSEFDASTPSDVEILPDATHAEWETQLEALSAWATVRETIDQHKEALRMARRTDGRLTV